MELNDQIEQAIHHSKLVSGYLEGKLDDAQQAELVHWINESEHNRDLFEKLCNESNLDNAHAVFSLFDTESALAAVKRSPDFVPYKAPVKRWPAIAMAAAVAGILLSIGIYFYQADHKRVLPPTAYNNDVEPGKSGATLTLANGKQIRLGEVGNGDLAKEAGVNISKTDSGQLVYTIQENSSENKRNTISTSMGETYEIRLPDGSAIWLNAASSLTYFAKLTEGGERRVILDGEGYFDIAKDDEHPFIVETASQEVRVLGTRFNINSYKDEQAVKTTLIEGAVKVYAGSTGQLLKAGQQAVNTGGHIVVAAADIDNVTDWKNNEFLLDNQDLQYSLRKIARWYDLEIVYGPGVPLNAEIGGGISRNSKLSSVLKLIESIGLVHFRIEGRKLYVDK